MRTIKIGHICLFMGSGSFPDIYNKQKKKTNEYLQDFSL